MMDFINTDNYRDQQLHNYLDSLREEKDTDDEEIEARRKNKQNM